MPIDYLRCLSGRERTPQANRHLGPVLALVAGAANAGGFLAVLPLFLLLLSLAPVFDDLRQGRQSG